MRKHLLIYVVGELLILYILAQLSSTILFDHAQFSRLLCILTQLSSTILVDHAQFSHNMLVFFR